MKSYLALAAILFALPAAAQITPSSSPENEPVEKQQKLDDDHKICRADARTSTRLVKRTCRTVAEWRVIDKNTNGANNIVRNP
ncbi:hypothetical protein [Sphingomonas hylomeconis]|uniref:Uncharacterized protein n=1 Tax=Sphingomonas hylomeconis TaxID=1395958 RepID=A0ABV7SU34_9SPHN|nr:hypothetical protein [Sphingomonas hylomeconis]